MKIFSAGNHGILQVSQAQYDKVTDHVLKPAFLRIKEKLMLGTETVRTYLSDVLDIEPTEIPDADYYKVCIETEEEVTQ